jgi:hypothetical protein
MNKAQEKINVLFVEFPGDYVVIAKNPQNDYFISDAFTYYKQAKKEYNRLICSLDIGFKISINQLNYELLKSFNQN